jgi:esterase/lipase superfamily enzyme
MRREITSWFSNNLGMDMPVVSYGHAGQPLLMFPTAAADFLEYERFYLVDAIKDFIESGQIRAYSINSVNKYSLLNKESHPGWKVEMMTRYDRYVTDEVIPFIRNEAGPDARPITTGASLGALLAANTYFKHSDLFRGTIAMSGSYDIYNYLESYYDENVYYNNPAMYMKNLDDHYHLPRLRQGDFTVIVSGQGAYEAPEGSRELSGILNSKGIPHRLELWGHDVNHDWPWWRKMLPYYLGEFLKQN